MSETASEKDIIKVFTYVMIYYSACTYLNQNRIIKKKYEYNNILFAWFFADISRLYNENTEKHLL